MKKNAEIITVHGDMKITIDGEPASLTSFIEANDFDDEETQDILKELLERGEYVYPIGGGFSEIKRVA